MKLTSPLLTDLYELTMAAGYFENNYNPISTFELFVRNLPRKRNYLVYAGLEQVVDFLIHLQFTPEDIDFLRGLPQFASIKKEFWEYLETFRFTGDMWSMREGEIVFPQEPILRITAPIIEAQIIETFLLATINYQTLIASKASRVVTASQLDKRKRLILEFGSRRAHGAQASVLAARATYIAGVDGTSNVLAGKEFGIPVYGTAAHSWTMAFPNELEAFKAYFQSFPQSTILLVDTYDIKQGIQNAIHIGPQIKGIRIDSGNLLEESKRARKMLDEAGMNHVMIVVSGDLNEYKIEKLIKYGAPIDSFGVGTQMVTSFDAPALGGIYKLVEIEQDGKCKGVIKLSNRKKTYPGKKQIFRVVEHGKATHDLICRHFEENHGEKLLHEYISQGKLIKPLETIEEARAYHLEQRKKFDERLFNLNKKYVYPVKRSKALEQYFKEVRSRSL